MQMTLYLLILIWYWNTWTRRNLFVSGGGEFKQFDYHVKCFVKRATFYPPSPLPSAIIRGVWYNLECFSNSVKQCMEVIFVTNSGLQQWSFDNSLLVLCFVALYFTHQMTSAFIFVCKDEITNTEDQNKNFRLFNNWLNASGFRCLPVEELGSCICLPVHACHIQALISKKIASPPPPFSHHYCISLHVQK